jgi:hypothetical protein
LKILIDTRLKAFLDEALSHARPRCSGALRDRNGVLASILAEAEAAGDAMRYLDKNGRIAWKATPQFREYLRDLQADAEADAGEEEQ